jgi:hypothetical protein
MAKIKKRKLRWKASESQQVVGYRLYWAEGQEVNYNSSFTSLGNVTEVVLPDDVDGFSPTGGPVKFGVAAVDELGNESDLVTFEAPYQFNIPLAPEELWIESLDEFHAAEDETDTPESSEPIALFIKGAHQHERQDAAEAPSAPKDEDDEDNPYRTVQHYGAAPDSDRQ